MHSKLSGCIFLYMTAEEIFRYIEDWAPPGIAWEKDNVGIQVGSREVKVKNILLSLELTQEVLNEAISKNCNLIITHHPLIFHPIKKLETQKNFQNKLIEQLIKKEVTLYSAHTNLDFAKNGVSFEFARTLKLKNITFLQSAIDNQFKIVVFVPEPDLDKVAEAVFKAGAGVIGEYSNCSFRLKGEGTFKGSEISNPKIGKKQKFEKVEEIRLEFITNAWKLNSVLDALLKSHPYEEPAYDIYPLKNKNVNYGAGVIGEIDKPLTEKEFISYTSKHLKTSGLRYCSGKKKLIKKVALCGGSGSELLEKAINSDADAFITADIKYHTFHDALGRILLIDAGHYETEISAVNLLKNKIDHYINVNNSTIKVYKYSKSTNPIKFYKQ